MKTIFYSLFCAMFLVTAAPYGFLPTQSGYDIEGPDACDKCPGRPH